MALLGTLSLPVVLVLSVGIAFFGYVLPSSIIAAVSGCIWIGYVMYLTSSLSLVGPFFYLRMNVILQRTFL